MAPGGGYGGERLVDGGRTAIAAEGHHVGHGHQGLGVPRSAGAHGLRQRRAGVVPGAPGRDEHPVTVGGEE